MPEIDDRVLTTLSARFRVSLEQLSDDTRRGDLERWDSLGHLELIEGLREEFDVDIPPEEALDMETVADIKRIMERLVNDRDVAG